MAVCVESKIVSSEEEQQVNVKQAVENVFEHPVGKQEVILKNHNN